MPPRDFAFYPSEGNNSQCNLWTVCLNNNNKKKHCLTLRSGHCSQVGVCSRSSTVGKLLYLSKYSRISHKLHLIAALLSVAVVVILFFFSSVTERSADKDLNQIWEDNTTGTGYSADGETSSSGSGKEISDSDDEVHKMGAFKGKEK